MGGHTQVLQPLRTGQTVRMLLSRRRLNLNSQRWRERDVVPRMGQSRLPQSSTPMCNLKSSILATRMSAPSAGEHQNRYVPLKYIISVWCEPMRSRGGLAPNTFPSCIRLDPAEGNPKPKPLLTRQLLDILLPLPALHHNPKPDLKLALVLPATVKLTCFQPYRRKNGKLQLPELPLPDELVARWPAKSFGGRRGRPTIPQRLPVAEMVG